ncbi:MAG: class I SAM-dependent methyltransferase [Aureispira sp.]|nr:class I SAM-dependent methyltransferase [Aureispira sp.]
MTDLELLVDLHKASKRQGPGSTTETLKALNLIKDIIKKDQLRIADIGCGSGAPTIALAQNTTGKIYAIDLFSEFLDKLKINAERLGLEEKIETIQGSMEKLPFEPNEFDIIWSEGAIYIMGFEKGIKEWRNFIKPNGFLAVSELTWTTNSRPTEIEEHWKKEYPEIDTASNKIKLLEKNGYSPIGYFTLPESCWMDNYYKPTEDRFKNFLEKHNNSPAAKNIVALEKEEIRKYIKYKEYFNYGFYIAQKV